MLREGTLAPDFRAPDQRGQDLVLSALVRDGAVVLYFYPRDFTLVCTQEACLFRDASEELSVRGARIVGVSPDDDATHQRFSSKHGLPFSLVADADRRIARDYEVVSLFGLRTSRVTFVIDGERRIRGVFHHELSAQKHVSAVQRAIDALAPTRRAAGPG